MKGSATEDKAAAPATNKAAPGTMAIVYHGPKEAVVCSALGYPIHFKNGATVNVPRILADELLKQPEKFKVAS